MSERIKYGASEVIITERADGRHVLRWRESQKWRRTTIKNRDDAEKRARKIAKRIDASSGTREVSVEEYRAIELLREALGGRSIVDAADGMRRILAAYPGRLSLDKLAAKLEAEADLQQTPFLQLYDMLEAEYEKPDYSKNSFRRMKGEFKAFKAAFPDFYLQDIDAEFLKDWLERGDPSDSYFNNRLADWKCALNWARRWKLVEDRKTAADQINKKRVDDTAPEVLTVKECRKALEHLKKKDRGQYVAFAIAVFAGLRPSEIQRLKRKHIDLEGGYINATAEVCRKLRSQRFIPILPNLKAILEAEEIDEDIITLWRWRKISAELEAAGILKWSQDVTRHSYISYRIACGVNVYDVAEECGNSGEIIKKHYRRPIKPELGAQWFDL